MRSYREGWSSKFTGGNEKIFFRVVIEERGVAWGSKLAWRKRLRERGLGEIAEKWKQEVKEIRKAEEGEAEESCVVDYQVRPFRA